MQGTACSLFAFGLGTDDNVYCWGSNASGQLGDGNTGVDSASPVQVISGDSFVHVGVGDAHSCGIISGTFNTTNVYCWGDNGFGQLGDASVGTPSGVPVQVQSAVGFNLDVNTFEVETRMTVGENHSCVELNTQNLGVACWGANGSGQLGNGTTSIGSDQAVQVTGSDELSWDVLGAGGSHTCAYASGGSGGSLSGMYCWGDGGDGRLGDGTTTSTAVPVFIAQ